MESVRSAPKSSIPITYPNSRGMATTRSLHEIRPVIMRSLPPTSETPELLRGVPVAYRERPVLVRAGHSRCGELGHNLDLGHGGILLESGSCQSCYAITDLHESLQVHQFKEEFFLVLPRELRMVELLECERFGR